MAKSNAVWGIDIGQCSLKALRCTLSPDGGGIVADKYDYIEFFVATIDAKTGGLRSIQFHGKRGNRGGQRIVFHDHTRPNISSQMVCRDIQSTTLSKIAGQIETSGAILTLSLIHISEPTRPY